VRGLDYCAGLRAIIGVFTTSNEECGMGISDRLQAAIKSGEALRIVYMGGSQPGTSREIVPISIVDGKVAALCNTSHAFKRFVIEKIRVFDDDQPIQAVEWQVGVARPSLYQSIEHLLAESRDCLVQLGWHIESDEDHLSLHRRFKNGKVIKSPDVSLDYEEFTCDWVVGVDGEPHEENTRRRERPWSVRGKNQNTRIYGSLDKAAETFLEWSTVLAPGH
jgi:hypothetical protein